MKGICGVAQKLRRPQLPDKSEKNRSPFGKYGKYGKCVTTGPPVFWYNSFRIRCKGSALGGPEADCPGAEANHVYAGRPAHIIHK